MKTRRLGLHGPVVSTIGWGCLGMVENVQHGENGL